MSNIYWGISIGYSAAVVTRLLNLFIWNRDKASEISLWRPSMCKAVNCMLYCIVSKTRGLINFIICLFFDVLLLIILTKAELSILNKIRLFCSNCAHTDKANTTGTNSRRAICFIIGNAPQWFDHWNCTQYPPKYAPHPKLDCLNYMQITVTHH